MKRWPLAILVAMLLTLPWLCSTSEKGKGSRAQRIGFLGYSEQQYREYRAVLINSASSEEADVIAEIAAALKVTPEAVRKDIDTVKSAIAERTNERAEYDAKIREAVSGIAQIDTLTLTGEFVEMAVTGDKKDLNKVVSAIFSVKGIDRAAVKVRDASGKDLCSVDLCRFEYSGKRSMMTHESYSETK